MRSNKNKYSDKRFGVNIVQVAEAGNFIEIGHDLTNIAIGITPAE